MKKPSIKKINPNKCNKKLLEFCQKKMEENWVERAKRKWKVNKEIYNNLLEDKDTKYLLKEYKYARILAGHLPGDISESWKTECIIEGYEEMASDKKDKEKEKQQVKNVPEKQKVKFNFNKRKK